METLERLKICWHRLSITSKSEYLKLFSSGTLKVESQNFVDPVLAKP